MLKKVYRAWQNFLQKYEDEPKSKFMEILYDILFELDDIYHKVRLSFYKLLDGLKNFKKFRKVIWNYRWYDYEYFLDILEVILKDWEEHYGTDSNFVGHMHLKVQIRDLQYLLQKWRESDWDWKDKEADYYKNLFFDKFNKIIHQVWD